MNRDTEHYRDIAIKSLAVLGLMTILALGSFFTLTALTYIPKAVRSVGDFVASTTPSVTTAVVNVKNGVTGDLGFASNKTTLESGNSITLFWDKSSADAGGSYALTYPCVSGVSVSYKGTALSCNVPFFLDQDAEEVTLKISSKKARTAEVPFTLRFTKNGEDKPGTSDYAKVSVTNLSIAEDAAAKKPANTSSIFSVISNVIPGSSSNFLPSATTEWGQADLRPVILELGVLDSATNKIIPTRYMSRTSKVAVRFAIENIGTKTSASWVFNAVLPTSPRYTYLPEFQPPLKPGERIEYTLSFDRSVAEDNTITITVDPAETMPEATKTNNSVTANFTAF